MSAATIIIRRQNKLMKTFRKMGATAPETAINLQELGFWTGFTFDRMVCRGVFIRTSDGRFYMDENAATAFLERRRLRAMIFGLIFLVLAILIFLFNGR